MAQASCHKEFLKLAVKFTNFPNFNSTMWATFSKILLMLGHYFKNKELFDQINNQPFNTFTQPIHMYTSHKLITCSSHTRTDHSHQQLQIRKRTSYQGSLARTHDKRPTCQECRVLAMRDLLSVDQIKI